MAAKKKQPTKKKRVLKKPPPKKARVVKPKKGKKKPRSLSAAITKSESEAEKGFRVRSEVIRQQAGVEYITDAESRSIEWWHGREDRPYHTMVAVSTFRRWANEDNWTARRDKWWREVEEYALQKLQHQVVMERIETYQMLRDDLEPLLEYMRPLRDEDGNIKRYGEDEGDYAGLPMMPLKMGKMHEHAKMVLDINKQLMLLRGEATARNETMAGGKHPIHSDVDPVGAKVSFDPAVLRAMAKLALKQKQPELNDAETIDIDHSDDNIEERDDGY